MTDPANAGGYKCPHCDQRRVVRGLMEQHIRREHPEEET